jgi:hypothetical protein
MDGDISDEPLLMEESLFLPNGLFAGLPFELGGGVFRLSGVNGYAMRETRSTS